MCVVYYDYEAEELAYQDEFTSDTIQFAAESTDGIYTNLLQPVFRNGKMLREYTLQEIRDRIYSSEGGF